MQERFRDPKNNGFGAGLGWTFLRALERVLPVAVALLTRTALHAAGRDGALRMSPRQTHLTVGPRLLALDDAPVSTVALVALLAAPA